MSKLINLKNNEHINIVNEIYNFNTPEKIYIPSYNINKDIKLNDYVYKNTTFENYITSISGFVSGIENINVNRKNVEAIVITNDYKENVLKKNNKPIIKNTKALINLLDENFLYDISNKIKKLKTIDKLIISSIDEEIYSAREFICLVKNYREILETINILINIFKLSNAQIVTKNTNFKSIKNVKSIIGTYPNIKILLTPDKYLIGHKKFLCNFLNFTETTTLLLSTNDIYMIYCLLNGLSINEHIITISGNAINKGFIINTKLGVNLKEILEEYIEINEVNYEIFVNGYLMGYKIFDCNNLIVTRDIEYIVINKKEEDIVNACINCGACNKICPVDINVKKCFLKKLHHKKCIGCGLCNYICPSNINLKEIVKSDKIEKNGE